MRRCWRKQPDAPLASRNLLRPLPVRTEASLTASDGRSWRSRLRRGTDREGQQTDGHDLFAKLPATARFLRIAVVDRAVYVREESFLYPFRGVSRRTSAAGLSDRSPT